PHRSLLRPDGAAGAVLQAPRRRRPAGVLLRGRSARRSLRPGAHRHDRHDGDLPADLSPRDLQRPRERRGGVPAEPGQHRPRGHGDRVRPRGTQPSRYDTGQVHPGAADRAAPGAPRAVAGRGGRPMSTLLPTSIDGSLPKPSWLSDPEPLSSPWLLAAAELDELTRDSAPLAASDQAVPR